MLVSLAKPRSSLLVRPAPKLVLSRPGLEPGETPAMLAKAGFRPQPVAVRSVSAGMVGPAPKRVANGAIR